MFICPQIKSQDFILGVKYGVGGGKYVKSMDVTDIHSHVIHSFGLTMGFSPFFSRMAFISGLTYDLSTRADYITVPLGARIFVGNNYRLFLEGNLRYSFLTKDRDVNYNYVDVLGTNLTFGFEIASHSKMRWEFLITRSVDSKTSLIEERPAPFNQTTKVKYRFKGFFISTGYKIRF